MLGNILTSLTVVLAATREVSAQNFRSSSTGRVAPRDLPAATHVTTSSGGDDGPTRTTFTSAGKAKCTAESWSAEISIYKDGYVSAVADAVAELCVSDWYQTWDYAKARDKMKDFALAFALAQAEASVECESSTVGKASAGACGYSRAYAQAAAQAFAVGHAEAAAWAFTNYCKCDSAGTFAFADAEVVLELWAEAQAVAEVEACAVGNQASVAHAFADCYAYVFAELLAKAAAKSYVEARCWPDGGDAIAYADAKAKVEVDVIEDYVCTVSVYAAGNDADAAASGGAGTDVFQLFHGP